MDLLDLSIINAQLSADISNKIQLELFNEIKSTNCYLMEQPLKNNITVCLAESQSQGRGRLGNQWVSPTASNIYLSIAHRQPMNESSISGFSLVIGIILAETLQQYCQKLIKVKWPNDLLVDEKKLAGILVEIKSESKNGTNNYCKIVTGIGINIDMPDNEKSKISQPCIDLNHCEPFEQLSRNTIIASVLSNIVTSITQFKKEGFEVFYERWNNLDAWINQTVQLKVGNQTIEGVHKGIDLKGALVLEVDGVCTSWASGEVSLRKANK